MRTGDGPCPCLPRRYAQTTFSTTNALARSRNPKARIWITASTVALIVPITRQCREDAKTSKEARRKIAKLSAFRAEDVGLT